MKDEYHWTESLTSIVNAEATLKEVTRFNEGGPPINALDLSDKQRYYSSELALQYSVLEQHFFQAGPRETS